MAKHMVLPGQRYRAQKLFNYVWEVEQVVSDSDGHPHARLHSVEDPTEHRTIACDVLLDPDRYTLIWQPAGDNPDEAGFG